MVQYSSFCGWFILLNAGSLLLSRLFSGCGERELPFVAVHGLLFAELLLLWLESSGAQAQ